MCGCSCVPPTGDLARNPGMCPDQEPNRWPFGSQAGAHTTEPHQPGLNFFLKDCWYCLPSLRQLHLLQNGWSFSSFHLINKIIWRATEIVCFFWSIFQQYRSHESDLCADDAMFTKISSKQCVISQGNSLFVDFAITTLIHHFIYWLQGWVSPCNIWFPSSQYVSWSFVELNKGVIEDLVKVKKLQYLSDLLAHAIDTSDPDNKCQFGFCGYIEVASFSCHSRHSNFVAVHVPIFLVIVLGFFIDKEPCLSEHLLDKPLSQALIFSSAKFLCFCLRVSGTTRTFSSAPSMVPAGKEDCFNFWQLYFQVTRLYAFPFRVWCHL